MTVLDGTFVRHPWDRASDSEAAEAVANLPLFATLGRRQLRKLARSAELASFVPGDMVVRSDEPADFFYAVVSGRAELRDDGTTQRLRRGDYFGEASLLDATGRSPTVVATDELEVMRLPGQVFVRLVQQSPVVAFAVLTQVGRRVQRRGQQSIPRFA